jgi:hypothetical protein
MVESLCADLECGMSSMLSLMGQWGEVLQRRRSARANLNRHEDADPSLVQVMMLITSEMQASRCGQPFFMNRAGDIIG